MPPGWPITRQRILRRDRWRCVRCGAPATDVHHTDLLREDDASLVSLCTACHLPASLAQAAAARALHRP